MSDHDDSDHAAVTVVGVKSSLAYGATAVLAALLFFVVLPFAFRWGDLVAGTVLALSAVLVAARLASTRSVVLYYDAVGVWVVAGVLPWRRRVTGLKWRDMDEAAYDGGLWSWMTRSWTLRVSHRHTRVNAILLTHIAGGKQAVASLNARHQQWLQAHGETWQG
ncbi:hypothetical protein [Massilia sp. DWR3-1-1]|uniref:hypothetical protein n=1 Tax=Massilia sp. DWR3-1-1 TaxID=2804559 RepID=UPI003CF6D129